jgi:ribosome-binding factor A
MSQRVAKVESLIQQLVARALVEQLERDAAAVTVTRVDSSPDLKNAVVWIGMLGKANAQDQIWAHIERKKGDLQAAVADAMSTKFVPRLHFKRDSGGEYAAEIDRLLRQI